MIQRKKKICKCGCGKQGYIYARGMLLDCDRRENPHKHGITSKPNKKTFIAPVSKGQAKRLAEYRKKRDKFLADHPTCQWTGCTKPSTLHHAKGRIGNNLTDESTFRALCVDHHRYIEEHPEEAKRLGFSVSRLAK